MDYDKLDPDGPVAAALRRAWEAEHGPMRVVYLVCGACSFTVEVSSCFTLVHREPGLHALVRGWDRHVSYISGDRS